jgi:hypothetical protein
MSFRYSRQVYVPRKTSASRPADVSFPGPSRPEKLTTGLILLRAARVARSLPIRSYPAMPGPQNPLIKENRVYQEETRGPIAQAFQDRPNAVPMPNRTVVHALCGHGRYVVGLLHASASNPPPHRRPHHRAAGAVRSSPSPANSSDQRITAHTAHRPGRPAARPQPASRASRGSRAGGSTRR